jgi:transposase
MNHPKVGHPKMGFTYVGIDSHKDTHTAVFIDCFFEKLGEITFKSLPSAFSEFMAQAEMLRQDGTKLMFGLEDISSYGRSLFVFLRENDQQIRHVNALLVARERDNQNIVQKTDSVDAECAARLLISKFGEHPGEFSDDRYYILKSLVTRRNFMVRNNTSLKNHLHSILTQHYPNYKSYFPEIDSKSSLAFFSSFPSPSALKNTSCEELTAFLKEASNGRVGAGRPHSVKAKEILDSIQDTSEVFMQEIRDEAVRSTIRQIQANSMEIHATEVNMAAFLEQFNCTLTSMNGIDTVCSAQLLSCIGDISRFSTSAKLARYAGIAPVTKSSGKKDLQIANQRGNRELNSIFYLLSVRLIGTSKGKVVNSFFYDYFHRKVSEGKTKMQALKCVQRRLVNIVWAMLTHNNEYVNPPMYSLPKEESETGVKKDKKMKESY